MSHLGQEYTPLARLPALATQKQRLQIPGEVAKIYDVMNAVRTIESTSNTTPIVVTTNDPHNYLTDDKIIILGTGTAADSTTGPWTITKISATEFSLNTSTAAGGSGTVGSAVDANGGNMATLIDAVHYLARTILGLSTSLVAPVNVSLPGTLTVAGTSTLTGAVVASNGLTVDTVTAEGGTQVTFNDPIQGADSTVYAQLDHFTPTANPDPADDFGANHLTAPDVPKAWTTLTSDGVGGVSYAGGRNIASVVAAGSNQGWAVTMAHDMTDTNYSVTATYQIIPSADSTNCWVPKVDITGINAFTVKLQRSSTEAYVNVTSAVYGVCVQVMGRQTAA